jgi:hypothetical protein
MSDSVANVQSSLPFVLPSGEIRRSARSGSTGGSSTGGGLSTSMRSSTIAPSR